MAPLSPSSSSTSLRRLTGDALAALALGAAPLEDVLRRALDALQFVIPYDLAVILDLDRDRDELRVRTATGRLADARVRGHRVELSRFPTIKRAIDTRRPIALLEHHHASDEGDPYDDVLAFPHGHSCMVVPLFSADRSLGVMTFDRAVCEPYQPEIVQLAGVYGQLLALAILYAEQAARLDGQQHKLREQNRLLREERFGAAAAALLEVTRSPEMRRLVRQGKQVAPTLLPVLIGGETGVGKELLARAIHEWSGRRDEGMVSLNCAAIPDNLIESELFGHVRGAFTGAASARAGRFLTANGGTLFLDEIGEMPLAAQAKLLRVLQEGTFEPVGSDRTVTVDVRVIAATNVDLEEAVEAGRFRQDLYYRLDVFPLEIPPLRERAEDILPIAAVMLDSISTRTGRGPWVLSADGQAALMRQAWPGNVRQLVNTLERATLVSSGGVLSADDLIAAPPRRRRASALDPTGSAGAIVPLDEMERRYIAEVLRRTNGRIYGKGGAAEALGLKPTTLQSRMQKLGIPRVEARDRA